MGFSALNVGVTDLMKIEMMLSRFGRSERELMSDRKGAKFRQISN